MMPGYQEYQFRNESGNARQETGGLRASQETGKPATNQEEGAVRRRHILGTKTKSRTQRPCFWVSLKEIWSIGRRMSEKRSKNI